MNDPRVRRPVVTACILTLLLALSGCATIITGTHQTVYFKSNPPGADIAIDGQAVGKAPMQTSLSRGGSYKVDFKLEGYEPATIQTDFTFNWWMVGNVIFGGLIGIIVDFVSGAYLWIDPEHVSVTLKAAAP